MRIVLTILTVATAAFFGTNLEHAFDLARVADWNGTARALDAAHGDSPELFSANNVGYLRGRVAEKQNDWGRAWKEFSAVDATNPLLPLAAWHAAQASLRLGDIASAERLVDQLPANFSAELRMQIANEAPQELALRIYQGINTREARLKRATIQGDSSALWTLLRERNTDTAALLAARQLALQVTTPKEMMDIGDAFYGNRQFDDALPFYKQAGNDSLLAPQARYQMARIDFQKQNYRAAIEGFSDVAKTFPSTDWKKDAEYQIANCYWRLGEYRNSEKAYLDYIAAYGGIVKQEGATRNLVDVYRVLGENAKGLALLDKALAHRLSTPTRQVFLFTKAKILFAEKKYSAALPIFRQLAAARLQTAPGSATKEEAQYYAALSLSNTGQKSAANSIWKTLAADSLTYFGQKAAERLGQPTHLNPAHAVCQSGTEPALRAAEDSIRMLNRPTRTAPSTSADALSELIYLRLWDEAALWIDRQPRPNARTAAELSYLGGHYNRSIAYADRLPRTDAYYRSLRFPAGYRSLICNEASIYGLDPLWLHAIIWQESKYNPSAESGASARGLMQFIPETANAVAAELGLPSPGPNDLFDPALNIRLGAKYWASLLAEFKEPEMALAAYNGGPDNVRRWKSKWPDGDAAFFVSDIGFTETKSYVMAVVGARAAYGSLK